MKRLVIAIGLLISTTLLWAQTIKIYSPYSPSHSGTAALLRIVDQANTLQSVYKFLVEFKPGGNQLIALNALDQYSVAVIAPAYVDNIANGKIKKEDYIPVWSLGDACWVGITNVNLQAVKELTVGGVGFGNTTHLTALALGEKYKFDVRYIVFKSNNDALINMVGNHGINFVIDRYEAYAALKQKNTTLRLVAASCPTRIPQQPNLPSFKEIGINAPYVFNTVVARKDMPSARRLVIGKILKEATQQVGKQTMFDLSAFRPPQFYNIEVEQFHNQSVSTIKKLQLKFGEKIKQ